jgi:Rhodopirellula transposase DDE domain
MDVPVEVYDNLLRSAARRLTGHQRRLFEAEVADALCQGSPRAAERRFGFCRDTVATGQHEARSGIRCVEDFVARGKLPAEVKDPQLAADIRAIVEPHTSADPEMKSARRYTNLSAREVLEALQLQKGYTAERLPGERSLRDILNRMGYRLRRIQKAKPLKKLPQTDAIFANIDRVKEEYTDDPETLEISYDAKAKVNEGDYSRGGKREDRLRGGDGPGLGPRPAAEAEVDAPGHPGAGHGGADADLLRPRHQRLLGGWVAAVVGVGEGAVRAHQATGDLPGQRPEQRGQPDPVVEAGGGVL